MTGGFAFVATVFMVFIEALKIDIGGNNTTVPLIEISARTYNGKAKGRKLFWDPFAENFELMSTSIAESMWVKERSKAPRLLASLLALVVVDVKKIHILLGVGSDAADITINQRSEDGQERTLPGFLIVNPMPSVEVAQAFPGQRTGLPKGISAIGMDRVHELYTPALGAALPGNACPQTVKLDHTKNSHVREHYQGELAKLLAESPGASDHPRITRLMSYSPVLLEANDFIETFHAAERIHPKTFLTANVCLGDIGYPVITQAALENLEGVAKHISRVIEALRCNGGSGRLETQFDVSSNRFEVDFKQAIKSQLAIFKTHWSVANAIVVADLMNMVLSGLVALGKAATRLLSSVNSFCDENKRFAGMNEFLNVWTYLCNSIGSFFSGVHIAYEDSACLPREAIIFGHRPLFNPTWKMTLEKAAEQEGKVSDKG